MELIPVNEVPIKVSGRHDLQKIILDFMNDDCKNVKINFTSHDYKSAMVCCSCFRAAIKRSGFRVKVSKRGNDVFLSKM